MQSVDAGANVLSRRERQQLAAAELSIILQVQKKNGLFTKNIKGRFS
jgi:hypothetical protein